MHFTEEEIEKYRLQGSFLEFLRVFYYIRNNRKFELSEPVGRESHYMTIARELKKVFKLETLRLVLNVFPGSGKSTMASYFVAWTFTHYADCKWLYLAHSQSLAEKNTAEIKAIMTLPSYKKLFNVHIDPHSKSKSNFATTAGGRVMAFGSSGSIVGQDAGLPNLDRFSGGIMYDDAHKPDEVFSDTRRHHVIDNYNQTVKTRPRGELVPIVFLGQRLHEDDLPAFLINGKDGNDWKKVILPSLDGAGNALAPNIWTKQRLMNEAEYNPYVFASQHQQNPSPAGGGIFKIDDFVTVHESPKIECTFLTIDTAETDKTYNDASVFSFWGVHKIMYNGSHLDGMYGLYWIDCLELRVEPKDLENEFMEFYASALVHKPQPSFVAIEKKSTGVTLSSVLKTIPGLKIIDVARTRASGSKTTRYLEAQPFVARKLISLPFGAKHTKMCIEHMGKITHNDTHRHDDICLVAGTKIATTKGYVNIEDMKVGDKVITPFGIGNVKATECTGSHKVITRFGLTGTGAHPVFANNKFQRLDTLSDDDKINPFRLKELIRWRYRKLLLSMESNITLWDRNAITLAAQLQIQEEKILKDCMWRFGNFIAERQYLKAMLFIIRTVITLITPLKILSAFHVRNTLNIMHLKEKVKSVHQKNLSIWKIFERKLKSGIQVMKVSLGIVKMQKQVLTSPDLSNVKNADEKLFERPKMLKDVERERVINGGMRAIKEIEERKNVFNLTIEQYGTYYAENILNSNCDTMYDAIKLALIDRTVINTHVEPKDTIDFAHQLQMKSRKIDYLKRKAYGK